MTLPATHTPGDGRLPSRVSSDVDSPIGFGVRLQAEIRQHARASHHPRHDDQRLARHHRAVVQAHAAEPIVFDRERPDHAVDDPHAARG